MRCSRARRMISDHIDNQLEDRKLDRLEAHLAICKGCRDFLAELKALVDQAGDLATAEPSPGAWNPLRRHLTDAFEKDRPKQLWLKKNGPLFFFSRYGPKLPVALGALLAFIVLTAISLIIGPHLIHQTKDPGEDALVHFKAAEQHYQMAIEVLKESLPDLDERLPSDLAAVFRDNLDTIDDAIRLCRSATSKHPHNQEANAYLMICYKKKLELLYELRNVLMQAG